MSEINSEINLTEDSQSESNIVPNHPLAAIAGQFEGDFWEATLKAVKRQRNADRKQCQRVLKLHQDVG